MYKIDPVKLAKELQDILIHRECVQRSGVYLAEYLKAQAKGADSTALILRCQLHDLSKMRNLPEFMALASIVDDMHEMHDINSSLNEGQRQAISLHWANNSHHPEYYESPNDMSRLDLMEMACDCHARSKQFGNKNVIDYILTQQETRFHFDSEHLERLVRYCGYLDTVTKNDDYSDILCKKYDLGFNFTDKTVNALENFDISCYPEYLYTDRIYLRRNDITDFATIQYEIHLKDINTTIGFVNIKYSGEIEFKIYSNYRYQGYATEAIKKVLETSLMDKFFIIIKKEHDDTCHCADSMGFVKVSESDSAVRYEYDKNMVQKESSEFEEGLPTKEEVMDKPKILSRSFKPKNDTK